MSRRAVLILSDDALAAALLGAAAELAGNAVHFPHPDEAARAALLRTRPVLALVDCAHDDACCEAFVGPAIMTGAQVVLVRTPHAPRDPGALASHPGVMVLDLPRDLARLHALLETSPGVGRQP